MLELRRTTQHLARRLGPALAAVAACVLLGFGAHAALDWHRHGETGAGFFHLHVHFGEHRHDRHGHDHHDASDDHDHDAPDPHVPERRSQTGTLTVAFGLAPAPAVASVDDAVRPTRERATTRTPVLSVLATDVALWSPRGPPA